jgi:hypothetical protein
MRPLVDLLLHALLAVLLLAAGSTAAASPVHGPVQGATPSAQALHARPAAAHAACDTHRSPGHALVAHDGTQRCQRACRALSAGFSAVLPMPAHALWLGDGASPRPDARHALPTGRVVMPERRPPRAA